MDSTKLPPVEQPLDGVLEETSNQSLVLSTASVPLKLDMKPHFARGAHSESELTSLPRITLETDLAASPREQTLESSRTLESNGCGSGARISTDFSTLSLVDRAYNYKGPVEKLNEEPSNIRAASMSNESFRMPEDYIQNFLMFHGMEHTFEAFQEEWYKRRATQRSGYTALALHHPFKGSEASIRPMSSFPQPVPELHQQNLLLQQDKRRALEELAIAKKNELSACTAAEAACKEKNNQNVQNRQLLLENKDLAKKFKDLVAEQQQEQLVTKQLSQKLSSTLKERSLLRIERDRLNNKVQSMQEQLEATQATLAGGTAAAGNSTGGKNVKVKSNKTPNESKSAYRWPSSKRVNPYQDKVLPASIDEKSMHLLLCNKGHAAAISGLAFNPKTNLLGTASDDGTWKLWNVPGGELVMSGKGHESWVSDISFHCDGDVFATSSGDSKIKLWSILNESCLHTISAHTRPVWAVSFHDIGDFFVSASVDSTVRCFDSASAKCRQSLRGHTDSVNSICFVPYTNTVISASKDKTIAVWDLRVGQSITELYGHTSSCSHVSVNLQGNTIASTDVKGTVKLWDIRTTSETASIPLGPASANCSTFDRSGNYLVVGSGSGTMKVVDVWKQNVAWSIRKHTASVQAAQFDPTFTRLATGACDDSFQLWKLSGAGES